MCHRHGEVSRLCFYKGFERALEFDFFGIGRLGQFVTCFDASAPKSKHCCVAAIVEDHIGGAAGAVIPIKNLADIVPIFGEALALDREHRDATRSNGCGSVILCGEDIARRPTHFRTQSNQRFDEYRSLDRHVQRTRDPRAFQRLRRTIFGAESHKARHFGFGDCNFSAAKIGERDVGNYIISRHRKTPTRGL